MTDLTLFNYRRTDPATSAEAAADNAPRAPRHRDLALKVIREHPAGLTDFELADLTGLAQTSIGKRRGELRDRGLVEDSGERRPSPSGSAAIVWRAVRYDQTITDHHQDGDGDHCVVNGHSIMHQFGCDFGPDCPGTNMPPHPDAKRLREDFDQ